MKRYGYILPAALAAAVMSVACNDPVERPQPEPELVPFIEMKQVTDSSALVRVYVSEGAEEKTYYYNVMSVQEYEAMGGDEAVMAWGEQYIPELRRDLRKGEQNIEVKGLDPEKDYYAYAFALSREGVSGSSVVREKFTTPVREYPEFKASVIPNVVRSFMMSVIFELERPSDYFTFVSIPADEYDRSTKDLTYLQQYFDALVESNLDLDFGIDRKTVLEALIYTGGGGQGNLLYLAPETEYAVVLMRMTPEGTVTGFVTEKIATIAHPQTPASFEYRYDKYYDAAYLGYPGNAAVPMEFLPNEDAVSWILAAYRSDYSTEDLLPDYMAYSMVLTNQNAVADMPSIVYLLPWDMDITLLGFAMDGEQNLGKVVRAKLFLTKEGASDIRDYLVPDGTPEAVCGHPGVRPTFVPVP